MHEAMDAGFKHSENREAEEPLLNESKRRFVLFPIQYPDIWALYKHAAASFWTSEEIDLSQDLFDWEHRLKPSERLFIAQVLAFFSASDTVVKDRLVEWFSNQVQAAEARCFYGFQIMIKNIHLEARSRLILACVKDPSERNHLFDSVHCASFLQSKADWTNRWISAETGPFAQKLVAFAAVQGIFLSGFFASIFWLRERCLMPGLTLSNELIRRDELVNTQFACLLFSHLRNRPSPEIVQKIIMEAVQIEQQCVTATLPVTLIGLNSAVMCQYIEYVADQLLVALGGPMCYHATNPFDFMETIPLQQYQVSGSGYSYAKGTATPKTSRIRIFTLDDDF